MMGSAGGYADIAFYDLFVRPAVVRIRERLENASDDRLREVINNYKSKPWYKKIFFTIESNESELEYLCARDMLLGTFSWKQVDEQEKRRREESERLRADKKYIELGRKVKIFDGGLYELENYTGKKYKILSEKRVFYTNFEYLGKLEAECLINFDHGFGIPVKKVKWE